MTKKTFAPKDAETLKEEVLDELGLEYDGNEDLVDKIVERELKSERFKSSLHADKEKHLEGKNKLKEMLEQAGLNPETGKKVEAKVTTEEKPQNDVAFTPKDYLALTEHKVGSEDFDKVMEISKLLGKPVAEALQDKTAQLILKAHREERATAEAAATSVSNRKPRQSSKEKILADYQKGTIDNTEEAGADLAKAQFEQLLTRAK